MKRSVGVTAVAVVALLGSASVAMFGIFGLFGVLLSREGVPASALPQQGPIPLIASLVLGALIEFGFAAWGFATAIGLLRLKAWSRISTLIFSGFLAVTDAFSALIFMILPLPETPGISGNFNLIFRIAMETSCAVLLSIAAWWLVLLTRKSVVAQFAGSAPIPTVSAGPGSNEFPVLATVTSRILRPLSITIIAWLFLLSLPTTIPVLLISRAQNTPVPFFWTMLEGAGKWIYFMLLLPLMFASGIALLRNKAWGLWLAIGIQGFGLMNFVMAALLPGRAERWERFLEYFRSSVPPDLLAQSRGFLGALVLLMFASGTLVPLINLWFLWTRRKRFLALASQ